MKILLAVTFVFGVIRLLTILKIFEARINNPLHALFGVQNKDRKLILGLLVFLDNAFFYFSLIFQAWYWLF